MAFDSAAAKAAGYTDDEIATFEQQADAARAAGYTDTEIASHLNAQTPPQPEPVVLPNSKDFERETANLLRRRNTKPEDFQALAAKYGTSINNAADLIADRKKYGFRTPIFQYNATPTDMPNAGVLPEDTGFDPANNIRSVAKGATFDFNDEIEAGLRAPFSDRSYRDIKDSINTDYSGWAKAHPGQALTGEVAGGIGSMFIPGVGWLGGAARTAEAAKALEGAGVVRRAWEATRAGGQAGLTTGALTGVGSADTLDDVPGATLQGGATGAVVGGALSPLVLGLGSIARYGIRKLTGAPAPASRGEQAALGQIIGAVEQHGQTPADIAKQANLYQRYGVPYWLGDLSPELEKLTLSTARSPSSGQRSLVENTYNAVQAAPQRVASHVRQAFSDPADFFKSDDEIVGRLRDTADTLREQAMDAGQVRDPAIMKLVHNPVMSSYWLKAKNLADQRVAEAEAKGLDPSKYKLSLEMEPVLDAQGALVGLQPTGRKIPDVRTLDYLRRAMNDTIDAGFSGTSSAGKESASAVKGMRQALDARLKAKVPQYGTYLDAYSSDKRVQDALHMGRDAFGQQRPQEVAKMWSYPDFTDAERDAYKTGVLQSLVQSMENSGKVQNFAENIIGPNSLHTTRDKLKTILPPKEFDVMDAALGLEAKTFNQSMKMLAGDPEKARVNQALDASIKDNGPAPLAIAQLIANPGSPFSHARAAVYAINMFNHLPHAKTRDAMLSTLAKGLQTNDIPSITKLLSSAEAQRAGRLAQTEAKLRTERRIGALAGKEAASTSAEAHTPNAPSIQISPAGVGAVPLGAPPPDIGDAPAAASTPEEDASPEDQP